MREEVLALLSRDDKARIRAAVAEHPNASEEVLALLSRDTAAEVRQGVASEPPDCTGNDRLS